MSKTVAEIRAEATAAASSVAASEPVNDKDTQIANLQAQLAQAMAALGAKTVAAIAPEVSKPVGARLYSCVNKFMRVPIMRAPGHCEFVEFVAGKLETSDPAVIDVLEKMIAAGGSGVTHGTEVEELPENEVMKSDVRASAEAAHNKMVAAGLPTA